jgi:hypothetical protein
LLSETGAEAFSVATRSANILRAASIQHRQR